MESFKFNEKKILIYAAGGIGRTAYTNIRSRGFDIEGFIDQRAGILKSAMEKPVWDFGQASRFSNKDQYAVVITLRNVFEHIVIADMLLKAGFQNLIFKPLAVLRGKSVNRDLHSISDAHDAILVRAEIPQGNIAVTAGISLSYYEDDAYITEEDGLVKAFLPMELLFTNESSNERWSVVNFLSSFAGVDLYRALEENMYGCYEKTLSYYIDNLAYYGASTGGLNTDGNWRQIVCSSRIAVFEEMKKQASLNNSFFIDHCTQVQYDGKMKFELTASGKNRVSFLIAQGYRYIPVKMPKGDYQAYLNRSEAEGFYSFLEKAGNPKLFSTVPHPLFYQYSFGYEAENYMQVWVGRIAKYISNCVYLKSKSFDFYKISILDLLSDEGCSSRFFRMLGCKVKRWRLQENLVEERIDSMMGFEPAEFQGTCEAYDIGMADFDHYYGILGDAVELSDRIWFVYTFQKERAAEFFAEKGYTCKRCIFQSFWKEKLYCGFLFEK